MPVEPVMRLSEDNSIITRPEGYILNRSDHLISVLDKEADPSGMAGEVGNDGLEVHPFALPHRVRIHLQLNDPQITGLEHGS
jgi:hypothetical protein